ncbi:RHS repeat-associated core domain-containing protein, partial [Myxococcus sp. RHSTA-1-4]|uniref:RHS repeat-associated core domain-containing protein n=1 Tax=Myxococcus sp. RHSTA-1-4 TaxID=2874601 RepID=UPI00272E7C94
VQDIYPLGTPEQRVTTFELASSNGRLQSTMDSLGRRTEFEFDASGNVTKVTKLAGTPEAFTVEYTYRPDNRVSSFKDSLGHLTLYQYDDRGNLTRFEDSTGRYAQYTYDTQGRLLTSRAGSEEPISYAYEGADLIATTDAAGRTTTFIRDGLGRMVAQRSPAGHVNRYEYDARDRLTRHTNPLGHVTTFTYDKSGRVIATQDARGKETIYSYNSLGLLSERMDPLGRTEVYTYDTAGRPKSFRDRKGQVSGWAYDSAGRMVLQGFGATPSSPESYANTIASIYDGAGRLTRVEDSLGPVITLTYDARDQLTQEVSPNGTIVYAYDAAGRLTSLTATGQAQIVYAYDDADRLTSITQGGRTVSFTYDAAGRRTSTVLPGGVSQKYTYDAAGQLERIEYVMGTTSLGDLLYGYDSEGNRVAVGGTFARTQLPNAVSGAVYDAASQLMTWKGRTLTHDANGNLTSDGINTYTWNTRGQLAQVSTSSGTLADFAYEPTGRRSRKTVGGVTQDYLYSGANFIQTQSSGGTASLLTGFGLDEVYSRSTSAGSRDFLSDVLGSTVALTDETGALTAEYTYSPYGAPTRTGDGAGNTQTFTGREEDGTGLFYFRARYYDPDMGRFLQQEPLAQMPEALQAYALLGQSLPVYAYGSNNPLTYNDPTGENPVAGAIGGAVAGPPGIVVGAAVGTAILLYCALSDSCPRIPMPWDPPDDIPMDPPAPPDVCEMAKGGKQRIDNEYVDAARRLPKGTDPCSWLKGLYDSATDSGERQKIKKAQKAMGCRRNGGGG